MRKKELAFFDTLSVAIPRLLTSPIGPGKSGHKKRPLFGKQNSQS